LRRALAEAEKQKAVAEALAKKAVADAERVRADTERTLAEILAKQVIEKKSAAAGQEQGVGARKSGDREKSQRLENPGLWIVLAMFVVGALYLLGQKFKHESDRRPIAVQILVGVAITVLGGVALKLMGLEGGEHLLSMTIAGILVIGISLFA
jgi:hypothetical protein